MRQAKVYVNQAYAGLLIENANHEQYIFQYTANYHGLPVSLTMPIQQNRYEYNQFPPFFDGLLPEGPQLESLLKQAKLDRQDYFGQLVKVGKDLVGAVTIFEELEKEQENE